MEKQKQTRALLQSKTVHHPMNHAGPLSPAGNHNTNPVPPRLKNTGKVYWFQWLFWGNAGRIKFADDIFKYFQGSRNDIGWQWPRTFLQCHEDKASCWQIRGVQQRRQICFNFRVLALPQNGSTCSAVWRSCFKVGVLWFSFKVNEKTRCNSLAAMFPLRTSLPACPTTSAHTQNHRKPSLRPPQVRWAFAGHPAHISFS